MASLQRTPLLLVVVTLLACHAQRDDTLPNALPGPMVQPPAAADRYESSTPSGDAVMGPDRTAAEQAIARVQTDFAMPMSGDPRLMQLSAWIATQMQDSMRTPPQSAVDLATRSLGLIEPAPHFIVVSTGDSNSLEQRLITELSSLASQHGYTHFGAFTRNDAGAHFAVVSLSFRYVELSSVPRELSVGSAIAVEGVLTHAHVQPELAVTRPDGQVDRSPQSAQQKFSWHVPTPVAGVYRAELLAQGPRGITVVANFPVYVGVPVPQQIELPSQAPAVATGNESEQMLALLNDERTHAGLEPLVLDAALSAVALAHDQDMLANHFIAHTSETTGNAPDRVARAGIRTPLVLENIGRGYSLREVHEGLMSSPGHRANVLHPQATNVGIAAVTEQDHDVSAYLVTEVFSRVTPDLEDDAQEKLRQLINDERERHHTTRLKDEAALSEIAERAARSFCEDEKQDEAHVMERAHADLERVSVEARHLQALLTVVSGLEDVAKIEAVLAPNLHVLGVGVAQGSRPNSFPNAICALLLLGE